MTEDLSLNPLTQFLAHLTKSEQLQVMMTHPFFTGCCPDCGHEFVQMEPPMQHWNCERCGWADQIDRHSNQSLLPDRPLGPA